MWRRAGLFGRASFAKGTDEDKQPDHDQDHRPPVLAPAGKEDSHDDQPDPPAAKRAEHGRAITISFVFVHFEILCDTRIIRAGVVEVSPCLHLRVPGTWW